jgi:hypothetical protein
VLIEGDAKVRCPMSNLVAVHRSSERLVFPFLFYGFDFDIEDAFGWTHKSHRDQKAR